MAMPFDKRGTLFEMPLWVTVKICESEKKS